jgi:type IV pilus assembly protein PilB
VTTSPAGTNLPPRQTPPARERRRLGDILVESGLLTQDQLEQALREQRVPTADGKRRRLGQVVSELGFANERQVAEALAKLLGLKMIDLSKVIPAPDIVQILPESVARRHRVIVLEKTDNRVVVAAAEPTDVLAMDDVKAHTRSNEIQVLVATESQINDQLNRAWSLSQDKNKVSDLLGDAATGRDDLDSESFGMAAEDAPIVTLVNRIFGDAVAQRASDIHIEVQREALRIRFRIDGILRDVLRADRGYATSVISRIKIMSGLDIAERRIPQDGRTRIVVGKLAIDCRISTLPSLHGEKVVIRLLTRGDDIPSLASLGFEAGQLADFDAALAVPQGLILITGPTGSGKTNTLYSAINQISDPEKNIVTLEDPVEVQLPGITQVGVNTKIGMTFAAGLRSILRQDPDIVLVGEVRDGETAELALKASLTGHLVLTTLHTNSAVAALTRLVDMGAEPFLVASSLTCAIAQRLVRRTCPECAAPYLPSQDTLTLLGLKPADLDTATPMRGKGCQECGGTGYRGRTAVYEVLVVDAAMRKVLMRDASESAIGAQARAAGMQSLRASALDKARQGLTSFEEAMRVTTEDDHGGSHGCPVCGRKVEADMVACPFCAATLDRGHCSTCGRSLEPDWRICPYCRTPAVEPSDPVPPPPLIGRPAS